MAITQKCTFCGASISQGTGKLFVRKDAKMVWLCSNKCEKNLNKLGRKARETAWTAEYKTEKKSRMAAIANLASESKGEAAKVERAAKEVSSTKESKDNAKSAAKKTAGSGKKSSNPKK